MKLVSINLDDMYNGKTLRYPYDVEKGIYADVAIGTSKVVRFLFENGGWTEDTARKYLKNRGLNKIYFRKLKDGKVFLNHVCLSSAFESSSSIEEVKEMFGEDSYNKIMQMEQKYNSDKPFVIKVRAMDFSGKDFIVGNGMKFYREYTTKNIADFSGLPIRLGHPALFSSFHNRVGNTIGASLDKDNNPIAFAYLYPHGDAGNFRENLRIAEAQGILKSYEVSMYGDPIDYELVEDDKVEKEDGAHILMRKWKPTGIDFVDEAALKGSSALEIANSEADLNNSRVFQGGSKVTITEILGELKEQKQIALSDFLSIDSFRKAVEDHVALSIKKERDRLAGDIEFSKEVIAKCNEDVISTSDRINKIVLSKVNEERELVRKAIEDVAKIADANGIKLNHEQMFLVKTNLTGKEKEEQILDLIKSASKFSVGLGGIHGFFKKEDQKSKSDDVKLTNVVRVGLDEVKTEI